MDPFGPEYQQHWCNFYEKLAGRPYNLANEDFDFDVDYHIQNPYPYCTGSSEIVGLHIMAVGNVVRCLDLKPHSRILEMGAGWGNTSLVLAQMGHEVTVADINPRYGSVIARRAENLGLNIDFWATSFDEALQRPQTFDCILFFESFHHSYDHSLTLDLVPGALCDSGILALAGEPLNEGLPYAWGLNPAGEALWQIRTHGWFELAFRESYLLSLLERKGFVVDNKVCAENAAGTTLVCRRDRRTSQTP